MKRRLLIRAKTKSLRYERFQFRQSPAGIREQRFVTLLFLMVAVSDHPISSDRFTKRHFFPKSGQSNSSLPSPSTARTITDGNPSGAGEACRISFTRLSPVSSRAHRRLSDPVEPMQESTR